MTRRAATNPDTEADRWALNPQQEAAVALLAAGTTVTDAAEAIGVARQTVSEWLHHHHGFKAALNRRREEV
jgi:transposase-like protein